MLKTIEVRIRRMSHKNEWKWYAVAWHHGRYVVAESYFIPLCKLKAWLSIRLSGPQYRVKFY